MVAEMGFEGVYEIFDYADMWFFARFGIICEI